MQNDNMFVVEIPVDGSYRYPMTAQSLAEDEAHMAENRRRREAGEDLLPPLPQIEYTSRIKYYVVDRNKLKERSAKK